MSLHSGTIVGREEDHGPGGTFLLAPATTGRTRASPPTPGGP
ncbi:hypothetical protein [Streptomyces sp. NPDC090021]